MCSLMFFGGGFFCLFVFSGKKAWYYLVEITKKNLIYILYLEGHFFISG